MTNPQVTPTSALKGTVSCNGKTTEALERFRELFTKIAATKTATAKAKIATK
jgi:hypothetical protein